MSIYTFKSSRVCVVGVDQISLTSLLSYLSYTDFAIVLSGTPTDTVDAGWKDDLRMASLSAGQRIDGRGASSITRLLTAYQRKPWVWWEYMYTSGYHFLATRVNGLTDHRELLAALSPTARRIDRRLHRVPDVDGMRLWEHLWINLGTLSRSTSGMTYIRDFSGVQVSRYDSAYAIFNDIRLATERYFPRLYINPPDLRVYNDQARTIVQALSNPVSTPPRTAHRLGLTLEGLV